MIFIERPETDPYFNIAAEEYVLKSIQEDVAMLWTSQPSVVVGKHQNTYNEINLPYLQQHHIPVIRRISGGGTVFHDSGNINFTLITSEDKRERLIDFHKFTDPIIGFLQQCGIEAKFEGKNNLTISGKKVSGNAAHVFKNRVMHHGTLLFTSELDKLNEAIHPGKLKFKDKAVQSIRADVANIIDFLDEKYSMNKFKAALKKHILKYYNINDIYSFSSQDNLLISELVKKKYMTWEWNYGYSPSFSFSSSNEEIALSVKVKNGSIEKLEILKSEASLSGFDIGRLQGFSFRKDRLHDKMLEFGLDHEVINKTLDLLGF